MCDNHLWDGPLICRRTDDHQPGRGCQYESTSGDVPGQQKSDGGGDE